MSKENQLENSAAERPSARRLTSGAVPGGGDPGVFMVVVVGFVASVIIVSMIICLRAMYEQAQQGENMRKAASLMPPEIAAARARQEEQLNRYTVIDPKAGVVGIPIERVVLGAEIEKISDAELGELAERTRLFARSTPAHKLRIIEALRARGHVVGFLGDGINDAPALHAADVSVSVDTAVDIAKEAANVILLEKSLLVLAEGVDQGRKVFCNILKYVRMGASSNFGNMFSVLGASVFLPFVPMAPLQILTNNLLYDFSQVAIPSDDVDQEQVVKPHPWSMREITRFILFVGPCSSIFDYTTFAMMLWVFDCWDPSRARLFQTGWFVESLLTQTLVIHVIRTQRIPFLQSRASPALLATTATIMAIGVYLPFSPLASALHFVELPRAYWPLLAATLFAYMVLTQAVKVWLLRRRWI